MKRVLIFLCWVFSFSYVHAQPDAQETILIERKFFTLSKDSCGHWVLPPKLISILKQDIREKGCDSSRIFFLYELIKRKEQ